MTVWQGAVVIIYLVLLYIQSERVIWLLKDIKKKLEEEEEE